MGDKQNSREQLEAILKSDVDQALAAFDLKDSTLLRARALVVAKSFETLAIWIDSLDDEDK